MSNATIAAARLSKPAVPVEHDDDGGTYRLIRYAAGWSIGGNLADPALPGRPESQTFETPGKRLHVLQVVGADLLAISFGRGKGWIPVREGDIIETDFRRFTVKPLSGPIFDERSSALVNVVPMSAKAVFLVSNSLRFTRAPRTYGYRSPLAWRGTATIGGVSLYDDMLTAYNITTDPQVVGRGNPVPLLRGGRFLLTNLDFGTPLYLYFGSPALWDSTGTARPSILTAKEVGPGSSIELDFDSCPFKHDLNVVGEFHPQDTQTLCVATNGADADYDVLCSNWDVDGTEKESRTGSPSMTLEG